jgi:hypothetical protein
MIRPGRFWKHSSDGFGLAVRRESREVDVFHGEPDWCRDPDEQEVIAGRDIDGIREDR